MYHLITIMQAINDEPILLYLGVALSGLIFRMAYIVENEKRKFGREDAYRIGSWLFLVTPIAIMIHGVAWLAPIRSPVSAFLFSVFCYDVFPFVQTRFVPILLPIIGGILLKFVPLSKEEKEKIQAALDKPVNPVPQGDNNHA